MGSTSKVTYLYALILIFYAFFYVFLRPRPKLNSFFVKGSNTEFNNHNTKNKVNIFNPPTNKVSVGKTFLIKGDNSWYQVIQISFWRKDYFNLGFLNNQLKITDIEVNSISNNKNYAIGTLQGEKIAYSCMENSNNFNYRIPPPKAVDSFDINHWRKVYIKNLNLVFYSFKPKNYECYVVLTPNISFFEDSDYTINQKIFNKFIYE